MSGEIEMKGAWWKILSLLLILYSVIAGFSIDVPDLGNLGESIRNIFFHVCMWFVMIVMLAVSLVNSLRYLSSGKADHDIAACEAANVAVVFGLLGIITGSLWAKFSWGQWWVNDPKLNGAAVGIIAYLAYFILRGAMPEGIRQARVSAVYNVFAFVLFVLFILILPYLSNGSIHPEGGNMPGGTMFSLDHTMRWVFYPAIAGWILLSVWILEIRIRVKKLLHKY